jgi:hypothetical protein
LHEQKECFLRLAWIRYFVPHAGGHSTERAGLEHEQAIAVLAFIADFDISLQADK